MSNKSISFNEEMIKAILDGRKTQTRRIIKPQPNCIRHSPFSRSGIEDDHGRELVPKYIVGDILTVKEDKNISIKISSVRAEKLQDITEQDAIAEGIIKLSATGRYVTCRGAQYFGMTFDVYSKCFSFLWDGIYQKDQEKQWEANPWVWVYEFERI